MNKYLAIFLFINNYIHDLATALLLCSAIVLFIIRKLGEKELYKNSFIIFSKIALFSLVIIILAGIPRVIFFKQFEYLPAAGKGIVYILIIKHIILFSIVITGIILFKKGGRL